MTGEGDKDKVVEFVVGKYVGPDVVGIVGVGVWTMLVGIGVGCMVKIDAKTNLNEFECHT